MNSITIEVAYATPERQVIDTVVVTEGTILIDAVLQSNIQALFPELVIEQSDFGIWGKVKPQTTVLEAGQRIEIYRPLIADPKESRRKRAEKKKQESNG